MHLTKLDIYQFDMLDTGCCIKNIIAKWASYQIRKIVGFACAGNAGIVFLPTAGKRSRHASRHVRHTRAVMHTGIAY